MNRSSALPYVSFVVDDDPHAIVRDGTSHAYPSVLVGWQCGFEPLFVAVHSCLDCRIDDDEAKELATDYLQERGWFAGEPTAPDYIIR